MLVTSRWNQWFPKLPLKSTGETTYVPFPQTGTNIFILHGLVSRTLSSHAYSSLQDALPDSLSISDPSLASPLLLEGEDLCHLPSQLQPGNAFTPQPLIFFLYTLSLLLHFLWLFISLRSFHLFSPSPMPRASHIFKLGAGTPMGPPDFSVVVGGRTLARII